MGTADASSISLNTSTRIGKSLRPSGARALWEYGLQISAIPPTLFPCVFKASVLAPKLSPLLLHPHLLLLFLSEGEWVGNLEVGVMTGEPSGFPDSFLSCFSILLGQEDS